jgi:hypothetical protein
MVYAHVGGEVRHSTSSLNMIQAEKRFPFHWDHSRGGPEIAWK